MITGVLSVKYIFIYNKCRATSFWSISTEKMKTLYLKNVEMQRKSLVLNTYTRICRIAPYLPKISYISSDVILYGKFLIYSTRFTSGGSRIYTVKFQN